MDEIEQLKSWFRDNSIDYTTLDPCVFVIDDKRYLLLQHKSGVILNTNTSLVLNEDELDMMDTYEPDYFITLFGDRFYYFGENDFKTYEVKNEVGETIGEELSVKNMNELRYVGKCIQQDNFPVLGIHGGYDLCNGIGSYDDYCKKASWLGITTLGICEDNTLAGTLLFQQACEKKSIKSIIGETITIRHNNLISYQIKLYVVDLDGWLNLLSINAMLNSSENKSLTIDQISNYADGLICVLTPTIPLSEIYDVAFHDNFPFENIFYQLDFCEWSNTVKEEDWIEKNLLTYFEEYYDKIPPIALYDCFYLEKRDAVLQPILWRIGKRNEGFRFRSEDRYFKSCNQYVDQCIGYFADEDQFIILDAVDNAKIFEEIDFKIPSGEKRLPKYELTEEQSKQFKSSDDLFWYLIEKGLEEKVTSKGLDTQIYLDRIQEEIRVIELGQVRDYFLIVWDIMNFCRDNNIITGIGRGSAAGCLISYLLGIVQIDPIHYGLLFERFLNEGRVGKSLPDIDNDIMGSRREEVKRYIERRYGENYVAGIGTYGTFKMRAALKDLIREIGGDSKEATYIAKIIDAEDNWFDVIKQTLDPDVNIRLYNFIKRHCYQFNQIPAIFQQPKTQSVHAAGVIIVPKSHGEIARQLPVKKMDGITITEWEGNQIEDAGFLKVDILGIKQLDKFDDILRLVKENRGVDVKLLDIPLDEPGVYEFFSKGFNEDVFQFGGGGLKSYCKQLRPDNIEDLIATVALYRPGPIEIGAHEKYAKIKNGEKDPEYYYGLEEITKPTYSQIVYQEQIMMIVQQLGGFTLVEADNIRKAMGKKLPEVMAKYKEQFIAGAIERGCPEDAANQLWGDMEGFAGYAFNRSHAACYAITGYYSQYLKYKYPLEFWMTSLKYSSDDEIQVRIAEIRHIAEGITLQGPEVTKSQGYYHGDVETNTIYWSLSSIKQVAQRALEEIIRIREANAIFSLEDFVEAIRKDREYRKSQLKEGERLAATPINRRVIVNLIISGAFDKLHNIVRPSERAQLLREYFQLLYPELKNDHLGIQVDNWKKRMGEYYNMLEYEHDYKWIMEQRRLCGFGTIDLRELLKDLPYNNRGLYKENNDILNGCSQDEKVIVAGVVENVVIRNSRNGPFAQVLVHDGYTEVYVTVWNEIFAPCEEDITQSKGKLFFMDGVVVKDRYRNQNVIHSKSYSEIQILS